MKCKLALLISVLVAAYGGVETFKAHPVFGAFPLPPSVVVTPPPVVLPVAQPTERWAFMRDAKSFAGFAPSDNCLNSEHVTGVLIDGADPHFKDAFSSLITRGVKIGIWLVPGDGETPDHFAGRLQALQSQWSPTLVVPDIEFIGKGWPGTPEFLWSSSFLAAYTGTGAVTVMPLQEDFDYGTYVLRGFQVWPQAYGATLDQTFGLAQVRDRVIAAGVPAASVIPVRASGDHQTYDGEDALYTLDDSC